jgi:ankyrin repeat protein
MAKKKIDPRISECYSALSKGDLGAVRQLLEEGLSPNAKNGEGRPLLTLALDAGIAACELLLEFGADINGRDSSGSCALSRAVTYGQVDEARYLISRGADVESRNCNDCTPLHCAASSAEHGRELSQLLLAHGADAWARTRAKCILPVHFAAGHGSVDTCRFFTELGFGSSFIPEDAPPDYLTPFQTAVEGGGVPRVRYYMDECGEGLEQRTLDGRTLTKLVGKVFTDMREFLMATATEKRVLSVIETPGSGLGPSGGRGTMLSPI